MWDFGDLLSTDFIPFALRQSVFHCISQIQAVHATAHLTTQETIQCWSNKNKQTSDNKAIYKTKKISCKRNCLNPFG